MILAYNTNGLAHHALPDAVRLLAEIGYRGVGVTIDVHTLNPYHHGWRRQVEVLRLLGEKHGLQFTIETGARYLLDPKIKHEPTLVSPDRSQRKRRIVFYRKAIEVAAQLDACCVSIWSGVVHDDAPRDVGLSRLVEGLKPVAEAATEAKVPLAFEPEPGMLIATLDNFAELHDLLGADAQALRLTIDVGHLHCQDETPIPEKISQYAAQLTNVHIEDMRRGEHEHLQFGDGEINFPPVIAGLQEIDYDGLLTVELSRHSHDGPVAARQAYNFLHSLIYA